MSSAKITLIGFYNYMKASENDLFLNMTLPEGIDKDTLVNNILLRGGEFEVLYSNPEFMQFAIGNWSKKWERTIEKWVTALSIDYNPLENYDRIEEWSETHTGSVTGHDENTSSGSGAEKISAFNSDTMRDNTSSSTSSNGSSDSSTINDLEDTHKGRLRGNIGITTSQQMLASELDIAAWNLYEHVTDLFLNEFVIPIY